MKYLFYTTVGVVSLAIIASFVMIGSPMKERDRRSDEIRLSNLQMIQSQLLEYWQAKNTLPDSLTILNDDLRGIKVPKDPKDGAEYSYKKISDTSFEICANFIFSNNQPNNSERISMYTPYKVGYNGPYGGDGDNWAHQAGNHCYTRAIDKDFFKPNQL